MLTRQCHVAKITHQRLDLATEEAAVNVLQEVGKTVGIRCDAKLCCTFRGTSDESQKITSRSHLIFDWQATWQGVAINRELVIRAGKALYYGRLEPRTWKDKLVAVSIPPAINAAGGSLWMRNDEDIEVDCITLGRAKPVQRTQGISESRPTPRGPLKQLRPPSKNTPGEWGRKGEAPTAKTAGVLGGAAP